MELHVPGEDNSSDNVAVLTLSGPKQFSMRLAMHGLLPFSHKPKRPGGSL
jgi:hypothetical protein